MAAAKSCMAVVDNWPNVKNLYKKRCNADANYHIRFKERVLGRHTPAAPFDYFTIYNPYT